MPRFALPLLLLLPAFAPAADLGLKVPADFAVAEFADAKLANDIYCMTIDAKGRVLVAGKGYVRHLIDDDADGKADRAVDVIPPPKEGPMGLLWEDDTLYVVTDGGLWRYKGVDGLKTSTTKPELVLKLTTGGEHAAHAVKRLPDGKLYVLCGNNTGITAKTVTDPTSPIKTPVAGCLLRVSDDGKAVAVIADGFRNAYDFDFGTFREIVTFDSDNERCAGLPWYEPTRLYHVIPGENHGWLNPQHAARWRKPPYYPDVAWPHLTAGRGSPTGVACYRHTAFPPAYRAGVFFADWTFGTVWFARTPVSGVDKAKPTPFLTVAGDNGFAPTGLAVHPTAGDLFVCIGGRGTRGAVYRVTYTKASPNPQQLPARAVDFPPITFPVPNRARASELAEAKTPGDKIRVLRGWQLHLGDLVDPKLLGTAFEGYSLRKPADANTARDLGKAVRHLYPTGDANLDRELSRTLAALEDSSDEATGKVLAHLLAQRDPVEKVHDLIVLARLGGAHSDADGVKLADALVTLDSQYEAAKIGRDTNWPLVMTDVAKALLAKRPKLADEIAGHPRFGRPDHVWLATVPGMDKAKVAKAFANRLPKGAWTPSAVKLLADLPSAETKPLLDTLWTAGGLEDAVLPLLARTPDEADRAKFVRGLSSLQASVVTVSAGALSKLPAATDTTAEVPPLVKALRRFADAKTYAAVRAAVFKRLTETTTKTFADVAGWEKWLTDTHPALAKTLSSPGYDAAKWKVRLAEVKWDAGNAERGAKLFATANCAACHVGGRATGPSLVGAAKRFSRDDLFTAILDPNRDVSPRYQTVRITTDEDKVYEGVIVYDAPDGVLLQTSADVTVRIAGKGLVGRKPGTNSLMPAGLLDAFKPEDLADLNAYLKGLQ